MPMFLVRISTAYAHRVHMTFTGTSGDTARPTHPVRVLYIPLALRQMERFLAYCESNREFLVMAIEAVGNLSPDERKWKHPPPSPHPLLPSPFCSLAFLFEPTFLSPNGMIGG